VKQHEGTAPNCKTSINLASVGYLFQITAESLVNHPVGKLFPDSQVGWLLHHVHVAMFTLLNLVKLCLQSIKLMYMVFTSHICTTIHYTNNTMAYNIQQNTV